MEVLLYNGILGGLILVMLGMMFKMERRITKLEAKIDVLLKLEEKKNE